MAEIPISGDSHDAVPESNLAPTERIEMLRRRLEQYNAAISEAMGHVGMPLSKQPTKEKSSSSGKRLAPPEIEQTSKAQSQPSPQAHCSPFSKPVERDIFRSLSPQQPAPAPAKPKTLASPRQDSSSGLDTSSSGSQVNPDENESPPCDEPVAVEVREEAAEGCEGKPSLSVEELEVGRSLMESLRVSSTALSQKSAEGIKAEQRATALSAMLCRMQEDYEQLETADSQYRKALSDVQAATRKEAAHEDWRSTLQSIQESLNQIDVQLFLPVDEIQQRIARKSEAVQQKADEMQQAYAALEDLRSQVVAWEATLDQRERAIQRRQEELERQHEDWKRSNCVDLKSQQDAIDEKEKRVASWMRILESRDREVVQQEESAKKQNQELRKREEIVTAAQKENEYCAGLPTKLVRGSSGFHHLSIVKEELDEVHETDDDTASSSGNPDTDENEKKTQVNAGR